MTAHLESILTPAIQLLGLELISCQFISEHGRRTLRIMIDRPDATGMTIEDCTQANRQIQAILHAEANLDTAYDLEVSSPGMNRPLITPAHFQRFVGCQIKISLRTPLLNRRHFTGQLLLATETGIQMLVDEETLHFDFEQIEKANLIPDLRF